jgi:hypothetical protein
VGQKLGPLQGNGAYRDARYDTVHPKAGSENHT